MKINKTTLKDCLIIEPTVHSDDRGFFLEIHNHEEYSKKAGITYQFVQDNHSRSRKNVLRGLHFQKDKSQGKLVRVVRGEIYDVALDIRPDSETFGLWESVVLTGENKKQFWIPPGFAHGFLVLSDIADVEYKCTDYYYPDKERSILWNDPDLGIDWPSRDPTLSEKDSKAPFLRDLEI